MTRFTIVLVSILSACAAEAPSDSGSNNNGGGGGGGDGTGSGGGSGGGSGSGSGTGTGNGSISATSFLSQIATKICDEAFTCKTTFPTDWGGTFDEFFGASSSACVSDAAAADMPAQVEQQITAGKIQFNGTDAATCVAGITFGQCTEFWAQGPTMPAACDTALVGTVADGGACVTYLECSGETSYCDATSKKCTADTTGARTLPVADQPWNTQTSVLLRAAQ